MDMFTELNDLETKYHQNKTSLQNLKKDQYQKSNEISSCINGIQQKINLKRTEQETTDNKINNLKLQQAHLSSVHNTLSTQFTHSQTIFSQKEAQILQLQRELASKTAILQTYEQELKQSQDNYTYYELQEEGKKWASKIESAVKLKRDQNELLEDSVDAFIEQNAAVCTPGLSLGTHPAHASTTASEDKFDNATKDYKAKYRALKKRARKLHSENRRLKSKIKGTDTTEAKNAKYWDVVVCTLVAIVILKSFKVI